MLYLIGLGLNKKGISLEGIQIAKRCKKIYLENYTVDFPYSLGELSEVIGKKIKILNREEVEGLEFIDEAQRSDVALLVYGSPLMATTHITILDECEKSGIKCKAIHSASILDAVAETGLQLYKFGKITSMPGWKKNFEPDSFMEIVKDNQKIDAHSLILIDIGLEFPDALKQLESSAEKHKVKLKKLIVCQQLGGNKQKIFYKNIEELRLKNKVPGLVPEKSGTKEFSGVRKPYCIIIPCEKLHSVEKEFLEGLG